MLSEEQAIDILQNQIAVYVIGDYCTKCGDFSICANKNEDCYYIQAIETVLNLITKLQKENEKYKYLYQKALTNTVIADRENMQLKKQIDLMAEYISKIDIEEDICIKNKTNPDWCNEDYTNCKNCIKQYFERKARDGRD